MRKSRVVDVDRRSCVDGVECDNDPWCYHVLTLKKRASIRGAKRRFFVCNGSHGQSGFEKKMNHGLRIDQINLVIMCRYQLLCGLVVLYLKKRIKKRVKTCGW